MNDLTFINHIEATQLGPQDSVMIVPSSSPAQAEGSMHDTYVHGTNASCSVSCVNAKSTGSFWGMMFKLFGFG